MPYYHVLVELRDTPRKVRCVFSDLTAKELEAKFLKPYRRGRNTLSGASVIDVMAITSTRIIETSRPSGVELQEIQQKSHREIDEFNNNSNSLILISPGRGYEPEDIGEAGVEVTTRFINSPPGVARYNLASKILNHPWVIAIAGGILVAGIAAWLG